MSVAGYRRVWIPGGTFFFTVVTANRARILCEPTARWHLRAAFRKCQDTRPFETLAVVLLPDHIHALWRLPKGDADYATRWAMIKGIFTRTWLAGGGDEASTSFARRWRRRRGVWQPRFWEHAIRDERDLARHIDYIHLNPVKHDLAPSPAAWPWSSFHRHVRTGTYPQDWNPEITPDEDEFGDVT